MLSFITPSLRGTKHLDRSHVIGRPTLYLLVDVFSHLIVGFHVCIESSSYMTAILALENATADKVNFANSLDISISEYDWPSRHLPEMLVADRGELEGYQADGLVKSLNIRVSNTAPYRADMKGIVERSFRSVNDTLIHWLPGAVIKERERGERDCRLDAKLTLRDFRKLMVYFCLNHNRRRMEKYRIDKDMMEEGVQPRPNDLWAWGIEHRTGHLRTMDTEVIRANLLPSSEASVTPEGIRFRRVCYTCERALENGWFTKARQHGRWKVPVSFDPRSTDARKLAPDWSAAF